ncbi:MAG: hypothetical protein GY809_03510, partial [Planctomycetes bacterium]|nr:hypothetical protein [Planctomycetota bacterium]
MFRNMIILASMSLLALTGSVLAQDLPKGGWTEDVTLGSADPGGSVLVSKGVYEVTGNGNDIWGSADAGQYLYKELTGDGIAICRVVDNGTGSNAWSKGGVMIRQDTSTGSTHAFMCITGSNGGGAGFQRRLVADNGSNSNHGLPDGPYAPPYWCKIERVGDDFSAYISEDGLTWTQAGETVTIEMADPVLIGLAVTSHAAGELRTYTFDNVSFEGDVTGEMPAGSASEPVPETETTDVIRDITLAWTAGESTVKRNVYLGASFDDVNDASIANPLGVLIGQDLTEPTVSPDRLEFSQTYFWRVDEVNGAPDNSVIRGQVWSLTTEPYSIQIPGAEIDVTASSFSNEFSLPEKLIDGSGLAEDGTHAITPVSMWFTATVDLDPWIQFEFDGVKQIDTMKVWNANSAAESALGWGVQGVIIEYSVDGETWNILEGANQFSRAPGLPNYAEADEIAFNGIPAKMIRLDIESNWGGILMSYGLSEVQFNVIPAQARALDPASGATGVLPDTTVTWRAGREVDQHTIYIGSDANAVADGTAASVSTGTNSLDLGTLDLQLGETYYVRVDEVNDTEETTVWAGPVWTLDIASVLVVDDFELYTNASPDRPFQAWLDGFGYSADEFFSTGYGGNGTGAGIGHDIWSLSSPYYDGEIMEELITMEGSDLSMPFYYSNSGNVNSETTANIADLGINQDWSKNGIQYLALSFRADSLSEALDTTSSFTAGDTVGWYSQTAVVQDDGDAAQSKSLGHNQDAVMQTTVTGAGTVSFDWKVSSEADWDFLEFYVDGEMLDQVAGEVDWHQMTYAVTGAGSHQLEWRYFKDAAVS